MGDLDDLILVFWVSGLMVVCLCLLDWVYVDEVVAIVVVLKVVGAVLVWLVGELGEWFNID